MIKLIEFDLTSEVVLSSLSQELQDKAYSLILRAAQNINDSVLKDKIRPMTGYNRFTYSINLSSKLRIILHIDSEKVKVLDILNIDLRERYFGAKQQTYEAV
ncbi:MAG: hypothetical protein U5L45_19140 [Saprospiraceae bacterium]|nr:hypothetical protein [Saprospiraceae bacterium]